jgi:N-acyl-D-amino-acid deacylase
VGLAWVREASGMADLLVRNGTVVDGTGAPPCAADVRVRGGRIAEVAPGLAPDGEPEIDATGAFVTPGIIETHTHVDGAMWWNPDLDPLPAYGATSVVFGNCGVSVAPLAGTQRDSIVDLFCFLEDLPLVAFEQEVPWRWETWPEYRRAIDAWPTAVNIGGYVGHLSLRTFVMGDDAWERAATEAERTRMAELLDASLTAGALGLSTNLFDKDRTLRPVPSRLADDAEFEVLVDVLARHPRATFQAITRFNEPEVFDGDVERFAAMCRPRGVRGQWTAIPSRVEEADLRAQALRLHRRLRDSGTDFWPNVPHKPLAPFFGFEKSLVFQRVAAWNEMVNGPDDAKLATLGDPAWRARARDEWDHRTTSTTSRLDHPETFVFSLSETGAGPLGISLTDYAAQTGLHVSDALADWVSRNGIRSYITGTPDTHDEDAVAAAIRDPHTLTNINDSGAHLQLFCGSGESVYLLTRFVRDAGLLTIEEAVHALTGRTAGFFGLADRGVIAPGLAADLAVFALDEIDLRPETRVSDVPGGSWRFTRPPAGFRATIVNGVATVDGSGTTGARPGVVTTRGET